MKRLYSVLIFVVLVALLSSRYVFTRVTEHVETVTITDKVVKTHSDGNGGVDSNYMLFTNHGTFEDVDSIYFLKFNSSDLYGKVMKGKTYSIRYYGWRVPFLSWYPNVVEATLVH